jgi:fatty acid desaturase
MNEAFDEANSAMRPARAGEKWALFFGLGALLLVPYFMIQYHELFAPRVMRATGADRWLPIVEPAIYVYISAYLLTALPLLLVRDERTMRRMAFGFAWIACVSNIFFLLWPTTIPALFSSASVKDRLLRVVLAVDTNRNACPSLHASLAIYSALCCARLVRARAARAGVWIWTAMILAATLLAKRHVTLDLIAGAAIGWTPYAALFATQLSEAAGSEALDATLAAREAMARGHEAELEGLAKLDSRKRWAEIAFFSALAASGVWLTLANSASGRRVGEIAGIAGTAVALNAFVLLMHEGMHGILFARRAWNRAGSVIAGATFLMSFTAYRVVHTRHHKYLGDARDPDDYQNYVKNPAAIWALHFARLTVGSLLYLALIPIVALKHGTPRERERILAEYGILIAAYCAVLRFAPVSALAVAWFAPLLVVGTMTAIRGFAQHGITDVRDPYIASRTIMPHPMVRFLLLNENFHLEHHLFPEIPSYNLPRLHRLIWPELPRAVSSRGYLRFLGKFLRATPRLDETPIGLERRAEKTA